jgi:hypothetical protein
VLVSSGYNNSSGDGRGYLYVLNAKTGALIKKLSTGVGSASDPSGLGQLSAWVHNADVNNGVQWVYGGDLKGNLWRFDLSATNPDAWSTSKLAVLTDATGNAQPITAAPELTRVKAGNDFRNLVVVGTGRYLGEKDVPGTTVSATDAAQVQTFYVIEDRIDRGGSTVIRADLTPRTLAAETDGTRTLSDAADSRLVFEPRLAGGSEHQRRTRHDRSCDRPHHGRIHDQRPKHVRSMRAGRDELSVPVRPRNRDGSDRYKRPSLRGQAPAARFGEPRRTDRDAERPGHRPDPQDRRQ